MGKAYIIGTGPGDEELLTLKSVKVLEKCTALLYRHNEYHGTF